MARLEDQRLTRLEGGTTPVTETKKATIVLDGSLHANQRDTAIKQGIEAAEARGASSCLVLVEPIDDATKWCEFFGPGGAGFRG